MTAERYPAVFTVFLSLKGRGGYTCLHMDGDPLGSGNYTVTVAAVCLTGSWDRESRSSISRRIAKA